MVDADGLWYLTSSPATIRGYKRAVLTPNAMEFARLARVVLKAKDREWAPNNDPSEEDVAEVARYGLSQTGLSFENKLGNFVGLWVV